MAALGTTHCDLHRMSTDPLTLNISTDVGDIATALATFFKLADGIIAVIDSPAMVAARQSAAVQAALEKMDTDLRNAQKTGDLTEINTEASG